MTRLETPPRAQTRVPRRLTLLGPAFVAAVAYVDPGNVATNVSAGAEFGYLLLWVVVAANLMAVLVQYLSAKLGLVAGASLPHLLGRHLPRSGRLLYWVQAEAVAMATDIAEVVGGAIALQLLFDLPLLAGGLVTGVVSTLILLVKDRSGQSAFEHTVLAFLAVIAVGFVAGLVIEPPAADAADGLMPAFQGAGSVLLAAGILGATVMPHAVYLHSALTHDRHGHLPERTRRTLLLRATRWDVGLSMIIAGSINAAMLLLAAGELRGVAGTSTLAGAHSAVTASLGTAVGVLFALAMLASGLVSTSVGCYAGAVIMDGLVHRRIPLLLRRTLTLLPALALLATGADPTRILVVSQVVLSFGIPFALVPLVWLTSRRRWMATSANHPLTTMVAALVTAVVVVLNALLLWLLATGRG
ncbi:Nramp family divalent metal transporter [Streptomyces sp. HNM0575]|uniref:Nramp family divalent metal transporter n=1 Tax=Streptomyces sp. HNM0575 TaxID=2716338 RepID=UPI00145E96D5|nr:Nramp family divalent metal transporter [Streptomyces sp. HNM0575]NLU73344.1 Nramp family divalent metal transporter [Streptomyces sp. HNM0575]